MMCFPPWKIKYLKTRFVREKQCNRDFLTIPFLLAKNTDKGTYGSLMYYLNIPENNEMMAYCLWRLSHRCHQMHLFYQKMVGFYHPFPNVPKGCQLLTLQHSWALCNWLFIQGEKDSSSMHQSLPDNSWQLSIQNTIWNCSDCIWEHCGVGSMLLDKSGHAIWPGPCCQCLRDGLCLNGCTQVKRSKMMLLSKFARVTVQFLNRLGQS